MNFQESDMSEEVVYELKLTEWKLEVFRKLIKVISVFEDTFKYHVFAPMIVGSNGVVRPTNFGKKLK